MGLLDGVLGNVLSSAMGGSQSQSNPMLNIVLGMLANGGGAQSSSMGGVLGNVLGSVMSGGGQNASSSGLGGILGNVLGSALGGNGGAQPVAGGGLSNLMAQFEQAGLGHVIGSWVGQGENHPISGDQLTQVLGADTMGNIANQLGIEHNEAAGQLSQLLPEIIHHLTPSGEAPTNGLGNAQDIMGILGNLMMRK